MLVFSYDACFETWQTSRNPLWGELQGHMLETLQECVLFITLGIEQLCWWSYANYLHRETGLESDGWRPGEYQSKWKGPSLTSHHNTQDQTITFSMSVRQNAGNIHVNSMRRLVKTMDPVKQEQSRETRAWWGSTLGIGLLDHSLKILLWIFLSGIVLIVLREVKKYQGGKFLPCRLYFHW
jgi:hypothetical protein